MDDNAMTELPPTLELLWGRRERPRRGPKPGLSLERIVAAAVEIADREGLAAVSMSRVAEEVGFTTMSLYRYVASKDELLALMAETAMGSPPEPPPAEQGWRAGLAGWARALMAGYERHPWFLQVPISGPPLGPVQLSWLESGLQILAPTRVEDYERVAVMQLLSGFVRNEAQLRIDLVRAATAAAAQEGGPPPSYGEMLRLLVDARRYPELSRITAAGSFDDAGGYSDEESEFGLQRILDGVAALVDAREREPAAG
ncbi:TetR/AcrR family transcriptional regulator [Polymorphospora sp. NPDC050346]|uniref:TetR/AcrR family transcriptional regulator n=1 Tax=Polymorphospora sp. NPDC050346 TaxID=3155780 RepID=UPI0033D0166B